MSSNITLIHGDCMEYMREMKDKQFDLAIVDPPYGIGGHGGNNAWVRDNISHGKDWDNSAPKDVYFSEVFRVSVNQIIWGANYFTKFIDASMGWICWFKTVECMGRDFSECEFAFTSFQRAARIFEFKPFQRKGIRIHPTQKPVALYKWLLKNYAKPGDKILDTHGGSCSLAIACYDMGYDLVGYEIDESYFQAARKRLELHKKQLTLFDGDVHEVKNQPRDDKDGIETEGYPNGSLF